MNRRRVIQVAAPHNVGHALRGVVHDNRQVIAGGRLLARQDHITPKRGVGCDRACLAVRPRTVGFTPLAELERALARRLAALDLEALARAAAESALSRFLGRV